MLERVWSEQTAHHSVRPLSPGVPESRGQCGVSSVFTARYLRLRGYSDFSFAEGTLILGETREEEFCWAENKNPELAVVVDITSDQFATQWGSKVYTGLEDAPNPLGGFYDDMRFRATERFDPFDIPRRKLMGRYAILMAGVESLSWWRRSRALRSGAALKFMKGER
jgi:hypothetical protein